MTRSGNLDLLDELAAVEYKKIDYDSQLMLIKDELTKIKSIQNDAGDVETNLKENIRKIQEKLEAEKETFHKLSQVTRVYNSILKAATDHMGQSIKSINDQFEHERILTEEAEAKEKVENKMETDDATSKDSAFNEEKKWQVVDQV